MREHGSNSVSNVSMDGKRKGEGSTSKHIGMQRGSGGLYEREGVEACEREWERSGDL